jgi:serine/threonine-protein kinase RsbW
MEPLTLPGILDSLGAIRDYVRVASEEAGLDKKRTYRLSLAVDEIATNIVTHGYEASDLEGILILWADFTDETLSIVIEDTAPPYDPPLQSAPGDFERPIEERQAGGLGIYLALQNVDHFLYERIEDRNRHTFIMNRA